MIDMMSNRRKPVTFVGFKLNSRGLSSEARSHAARAKRALRSQQLPPPKALRWRYQPKETPRKGDAEVLHSSGMLSRKVSNDDRRGESHCGMNHAERAQTQPAKVDTISISNRPSNGEYSVKGTPKEIGVDALINHDPDYSAAELLEAVYREYSTPPSSPGANNCSTLFTKAISPINLAFVSLDRALLQYFAENADTMLHLSSVPALLDEHQPVKRLFLPFALGTDWCFDTMICLLSAYYRRSLCMDEDRGHIEDAYITHKRDSILETTCRRVSAVSETGDSTDGDVVALLFLAVAEYMYGDKTIGLLHLAGWKTYLEIRRTHRVTPCSLEAKTIVWWVVTMMLGPDEALGSILDPRIMQQIEANPARLFRHLDRHRSVGSGWLMGATTP